MADIGYISLVLALVVSAYTAIAYIVGAKGKNSVILSSARNGLIAVCGLLTVSAIVLVQALVTHNFQIEYVASYTDRELSLGYLITAFWAGSRGSLLFWAWMLSIFAIIAVLQKRVIGKELVPYAAAIIMGTQFFFLILLVSVSDPFYKLAFVPADGQGLNPLLENPGMLLHPPTQLIGYLGFTIPFAFAMAALITKRLGDEWIIAMRRWIIITWLFLGIGNLIGGWWAYKVLGWGGYWAWDPVENAGLMPWLVATAFLHSCMMQRRRGILKKWNMILVIFTFVLSIFGTFLTRSGVLSSVHSFGESILGPFFMAFIIVTLVGSLALLYMRSQYLKSEAEMESLISRESTFLFNNLLLMGATFATFVGTVFPVISEAVTGNKITVGAPFFNQVNGPIFLAIILLTGICALIGWRRASVKKLVRNLAGPLVATAVLIVILVVTGVKEGYPVVAFAVSGFVIFSIISEISRGSLARHRMKGENILAALVGLVKANRPRYGGYIVHIGIMLMAIGVIGSSFYHAEKEVTLKPGESVSLNQYTLTFNTADTFTTQTRQVTTATVSAYNSGKLISRLTPSKYLHRNHENPVSQVAIRSTLVEDLYAIFIDTNQDGSANFKFLVNPLVTWVWYGGIVVLIGALVAFWPDRKKQIVPKEKDTGESGNA